MINLPLSDAPEHFEQVNYQGKVIAVGDQVIVTQAGQSKTVTVSSLTRKQGHYWVGYEQDAHFCPWPLVRIVNP